MHVKKLHILLLVCYLSNKLLINITTCKKLLVQSVKCFLAYGNKSDVNISTVCTYVNISLQAHRRRFVLADILKLCLASWQIDHIAKDKGCGLYTVEVTQGGRQSYSGSAVRLKQIVSELAFQKMWALFLYGNLRLEKLSAVWLNLCFQHLTSHYQLSWWWSLHVCAHSYWNQ